MSTWNDPNFCLPGSWLDLDELNEPRQQSDDEIKSNATKPPKIYVDAESAYQAPRYFL